MRIAAIAFLVLAAFAAPAALGADVRSGAATVIDGDTLDIAGARIELHGIDAPEIDAKCVEWRGTRQIPFPCGLHAKAFLLSLIAGEHVACVSADDADSRRAICYARGFDIAEAMVGSGWAVACDYGNRYLTSGNEARAERIGLWSGNFTIPDGCRASRLPE